MEIDEEALELAMAYQHDLGFDEGYELGWDEGYEAGQNAETKAAEDESRHPAGRSI